MNQKEIININWEGPFNIEDILEGKINEQEHELSNDDIGLYQIYGSHPLYGSDVLVYIGRTKNKNGFKSRLKKRWVIEDGNDINNVKIYLGKVFSDTRKYTFSETKLLIEKAEVIMINALKPAFNSSNIQSVKSFDTDYTVYNYGNYRNIYPIFDSVYLWKEHKNYDAVKQLADKYTSFIEDKDDYYGFVLKEYESYNIWLGIDYDLWISKEHLCPLCLQVYQVKKEDIPKLENLKFKVFEYENGDTVSYLPLEIKDTEEMKLGIDKTLVQIEKQLL